MAGSFGLGGFVPLFGIPCCLLQGVHWLLSPDNMGPICFGLFCRRLQEEGGNHSSTVDVRMIHIVALKWHFVLKKFEYRVGVCPGWSYKAKDG